MYPPTSTKIKLQKQIFLIDIFYSNYKENLYNIFSSMLCKVVREGYLHNKDGGFITNRRKAS
jgi:uncharacterized protein YwgA